MKQEELVSDEFWEIVEPLLPEEPPKPRGGRPRLSDRAALAGIIYVLKSGIPWRMLPQALGCGSGVTCWRRLRDSGKKRVSGAAFTRFCSTISARRASSTGRDPPSTPRAHQRKGGREDRSQPRRPGQGGLQAARRHRRGRCAARCSAHRRQRSRLEGL